MKIAIIGAGGVGGYFGGKIAKAGYDVTFVARGEHLKAIQNNGLAIKSTHGDFHLEGVKATDKIQDIAGSDLIILGVKAWQIKDIAAALKPIVTDTTTILPLQNGVFAIEELKTQLPENSILGGLCKIMTKIEAPGVVNHFGMDPTIVFGEIDNKKTDRVSEIKHIFDEAGFKATISEDINSDLWKKFLLVCVSGLLCITKTNYGELRELNETRLLMIDLFTEIYTLAHEIGIHIEPDFVGKTIAIIDAYPYNSNSSLTRDVWEGKPSEIEYQNGAVVKLAKRYFVDTPVNRFVYSCILPMEMKARKGMSI